MPGWLSDHHTQGEVFEAEAMTTPACKTSTYLHKLAGVLDS